MFTREQLTAMAEAAKDARLELSKAADECRLPWKAIPYATAASFALVLTNVLRAAARAK